MKQIWAPWRMDFLLGKSPVQGCPFCVLPAQQRDQENLILHRTAHCFVIMNRYPYNNAHLMVIPFAHINDLDQLSDAICTDLSKTLQHTTRVVRRLFNPDGFNIGINMGAAAGAGVPGHIHYHVIPRWVGDTNFMPVINETRIMNEYLHDTYQRLQGQF